MLSGLTGFGLAFDGPILERGVCSWPNADGTWQKGVDACVVGPTFLNTFDVDRFPAFPVTTLAADVPLVMISLVGAAVRGWPADR